MEFNSFLRSFIFECRCNEEGPSWFRSRPGKEKLHVISACYLQTLDSARVNA